MKFRIFSIACLASMHIHATAVTPGEVTPANSEAEQVQGIDIEKERKIIREKRIAADDLYKASLKLCYKKFAVNSCKQDALDQKIAVDNELRSLELVINNAARQQRGDKALIRNEEKQSLDKQLQQDQERLDKKNDYIDKLNENLEKNENYLNKQLEIESNREKNQQRLEEVQERQRKHAEKAAEVERKRAEYQRKQQEAETHRKNLAKDVANQSNTPRSLPKPKTTDITQ